jgi:hypothetical protein
VDEFYTFVWDFVQDIDDKDKNFKRMIICDLRFEIFSCLNQVKKKT